MLGSSYTNFTTSNRLWGHRFDVSTSRSLTQIEMEMTMPVGTHILTWVVYRYDEADSNYDRIFDSAQPTPGSNTLQFESSGTIDVMLTVGSRYFIGVWISDSISMRRSSSGASPDPSFGSYIGSTAQSMTTLLVTTTLSSYSYAFHQRLTSELP